MNPSTRISEIDIARGVAILLMIIYHFIFDLNFFGISQINLESAPLVIFQRIIGSSFLLIAGISLVISESRNNEGYMHHFKRGLILAGVALIITIGTWIFPHVGFIQFGIIHLIALSTIIAPFFFRFGKWNILFGIIIIGLGLLTSTIYVSTPYLFWLGLVNSNYTALDHYPILPWFGVILIGLYLGQEILKNNIFKKSMLKNKLLELIGKNSLTIYLVHQLILVGIILLYLKSIGQI